MRPHWNNCVTHFDEQVASFVQDYFARPDRRCLLVAGAGFDPRAALVPTLLAKALGSRLEAVLIREERSDPGLDLRTTADENEARLRDLVSSAKIVEIAIFAEDGAPVGAARASEVFRALDVAQNTTDVVLDMSAVSLGIAFPVAKLLLDACERRSDLNFHLFVASNPELDETIVGEPADRAMSVRGYAGDTPLGDDTVARIWLPQLARCGAAALDRIQASLQAVYKVCPMLPFPARNPRRADDLIAEFGMRLRDDWQVSAGDLIYVSERNPLDSYRTISTLKERFDRTVRGIYFPQIVLSPIGSKVMAVGAMMAAIEYNLTVQYVETLRYDWSKPKEPSSGDTIVHVWLHGPVYDGYRAIAPTDIVSAPTEQVSAAAGTSERNR
ncbi:hypothetical protein [uncultured Methylobacterium sp.]|uniref:hypothetical protein n=1 Tax=uncultured Methylobacterium sp. TaxID=157278 RepID=UPI0035CAD625